MQAETQSAKPLTDRQERFVFEYLKDQNASAAAECAGYSARSRASQANVLMNDPAVRERIRIEMRSLLAELRLTALDLMKERMRAGFFRAGKLFDASGRLLGFEEMEVEVRDMLIIGGTWGRAPVARFRMPNREPALRALERVHERLDKLDEAHYAALEKERMRREARASRSAPTSGDGAVPPGMWEVLRLEEPAPAGGDRIEAPVPQAEAAPATDKFVEKTQGFSGSANTDEVKAAASTTTVVDAAAPAVPESAAVRSNLNPGAPLVKRHDADLMWGGKRKVQEWEPGIAQQEHMAQVRHTELAEEARRNLEARGGRIKPGPLRPQGLPPGYNPPWLRPEGSPLGGRDDRPQFAIGAGECSLDD
ncbi:MAG TPA: terminase small subunit [Burkholderiales bacterium]|jgi:phage terminase small subunit